MSLCLYTTAQDFKGLVHPKMKIMSLMSHPHVVHSLRYFRFSRRAFCSSIENVCTLYCPCR